MDQESLEIYTEGYQAFLNGQPENANPYSNFDAEYWADGWADAEEDHT